MRLIFFAALLLVPFLAVSSTKYAPPKRSFTLSSGYAERVFNSNEALVDFPLGVIESYGALFDIATDSFNNQWWSRLTISLVELPISYWLGNAIFVPFHEFGHARAYHASGRDYSYSTSGYGRELRGVSNYWMLSLCRLITPPFFFPGSGHASASAQGTPSANSTLSAYWGSEGISIISSAGGLNNQSFLAKKVAQEIYKRNGHITQTFHYLFNKIAGWGYSQLDRKSAFNHSDIESILDSYKANGYSIDHSDLEFQSLISMLSGTTYALFRGYYNYVASGDARVYPAELFGFRIPDINSYINARGLSLEFVSGYRFSDHLFFDLAYEFIWKGDFAHQITPSAHFDVAKVAPGVNNLWINTNIILGKGVSGGLSAEWAPYPTVNQNFWQRFSYFMDLTIYNGFNLYGERNITSLRGDKTMSFSAFAGLRLNY